MISSMGGYRCCHIQFWNMVIMEKEKRYVASISGGKDSMARRNSDKVLFSFARGRERCDRNGHAVFLRPRVDFATTGSEITGISTSSTKLK